MKCLACAGNLTDSQNNLPHRTKKKKKGKELKQQPI